MKQYVLVELCLVKDQRIADLEAAALVSSKLVAVLEQELEMWKNRANERNFFAGTMAPRVVSADRAVRHWPAGSSWGF